MTNGNGTRTNGIEGAVNGNDVYHGIKGVRLKKMIESHVDTLAGFNNMMTPSGHANNGVAEHLYVFSAQSRNSLEAYQSSFADYLAGKPTSAGFAKSLAYTLGQRRTHFAHRVALVAESTRLLKDQLQSVAKSTRPG